MAFVNEFVSEQDVKKYDLDGLLNSYEPYSLNRLPHPGFKHTWTVDRERGIHSLAQANDLLAGVGTADELRALIAQLDISTTGSVTVLYSGGDGDFNSGNVARAMVAQGGDGG